MLVVNVLETNRCIDTKRYFGTFYKVHVSPATFCTYGRRKRLENMKVNEYLISVLLFQ